MQNRHDVAALLLTAFAVIRIAATWTVFSATFDEPTHVGAGIQLVTQHRYTFQYENPPVPRVILAVAPVLGGMRLNPDLPAWQQNVFYSTDHYKTNLVLARAGNLAFFLLAVAVTWWWARRELGPAGALLALFLFTLQPMILGHSGLATHDIAAVATVGLAILAFVRWLDHASQIRAIAFGAAYGLAITCKYSAIGYVPVACLTIGMLRAIRDEQLRRTWWRMARTVVIAIASCLFVTWAGFAFTVGELQVLHQYPDVFDKGAAGALIAQHPHWPLPAPAFFLGVGALGRLSNNPWSSFLFGRVSTSGFWWYFPAAIALKTTLASLILAAAAILLWRTRVAAESLAAAAAMIALAMPSRLDIGVRYVLPVYLPLTIAAASAALLMLRHPRRSMRTAAIVLLAWHCGASLLAHPDEFPYFHELAGRHPEQYLVDSNIDWGQDLLRLRDRLRKEHVDEIGLSLLSTNDYNKLGFPPHYEARRDVPSAGWVAVSETMLVVFGRWEWLERRRYERIGKSIRLYYVN